MLPSRGASTGCRYRLTGTSQTSQRESAKSCAWEGTTPWTNRGCPSGKQLGRKGLEGPPGGHHVEGKSVMCPCRKDGQQFGGCGGLGGV